MSIYRYEKVTQLYMFNIYQMYIPSKRERYGIKLHADCESDTGYLLRFIIYIRVSTFTKNQQKNFGTIR